MANDKLTWVELRKVVAETSNISEQEAGQFLNALLEAIMEGLKADKQVKIKGIGTFALKAVAARKSVNIATGETITIEGYNKLTFNAESVLKENVEKRLEHPKTEAIVAELTNDPIKKLGEQADEIVDLLAELGQAVTKTSLEVEEVPEVTDVSEVTEVKEVPKVEVKEPIAKSQEKAEAPIVAPAQKATCKCKCNCHCMLWAVIAILMAIIISAGIYFRDGLIQWWQCMGDCQPTTEEVVMEEVIEEPVIVPLAEQPREYVNFIGIERVGDDSRLAWIAYKYYAQKDLWVFIYEANRDIIDHPSHVRPGQYIRIPELSEEYRNLYNPELKQLVDSLAVEYLKQ